MIPYGRQSIDQDDIEAVIRTLQSDFLTQGPAVPAFEQALAEYCGSLHAVAVHSATAALHLACLALGVGPGDWVWTSPISFVASANCALYCGARIDFVDIEPDSGLMSVAALAEKLRRAAQQGKLPKVVIPVHLAGHSCDMQAIAALCAPYDIAIIEDASHAIGGSYQAAKIGSCLYSDICVFSFHPVKIITTAEGGAALTRQPMLAEKLRLLRSHGITRDPQAMTEASHGDWYYQQIALGFNYRMTDLQAALGLSQLRRLDDFVAKRQQAVDHYAQLLEQLPIERPVVPFAGQSAWHLYIIRLPEANQRAVVFTKLRQRDIGVNVHYIPIHTQPYYRQLGFNHGDFPQAEQFYSQIISLPLYADLTYAQQCTVADALREACQ